MTEEVILSVYDLSLGALLPLSEGLLGQEVEGFWHTGITVYGYEYFYGKTVHRKKPEDFIKMFGHEPVKKIVLGQTDIGKRQFEAHITSAEFQDKYGQDTYDVLRNNCNDFCRDAIDYILQDLEIPEEVNDILNNAKIIAKSPRIITFLGLFHKGKRLGFNFITKLMKSSNIPSDSEALQNVLDIFSKPSALSLEGGKINLDEEEEDESDISPEAAISGILDFFESFSDPSKQLKEPRIEDSIDLKTKLPPGAKSAAVNFGRNLVEAIKLVNSSIAGAIEPASKEGGKKKLNLNKIKSLKNLSLADESVHVPLTPEVIEFLESTFPSEKEAMVVKRIRQIFETNGYYEMVALKGLTEEEMIQMGLKAGWAKKLKTFLDKHFL